MDKVISIIIFAAIVSGGYIGYRYTTVPKSEDMLDLVRSTVWHDYPPAICDVSAGGFDGSVRGKLWIYKNKELYIVALSNADGAKKRHGLTMPDGIRYIWHDGESTGYIMDDNPNSSGSSPLAYTVHCYPWWLPDSSLFKLPSDIIFPN